MATELFGFTRETSGHFINMVGQMQPQAWAQREQNQNQMNQILAQAETQRLDFEQREEVQRAEAQAQRAEASKGTKII